MNLKVIGTGSKGNCYLLENDKEALLIECGVNVMEIKRALNFNITKVVGCLISHEHKDHAKSIKEVMDCGIEVFASKGTFESLNVFGLKAVVVFNKKVMKVGNFKVMGFEVKHDAAEPFGFLIHHPETGNVLFLTDTIYSPYVFKNLNNIIIEANYSSQIINEKLSDKRFLRNRIFKSHMSLETCKKFLGANNLNHVNNIVLIHLSESNSNETQFRNEIEMLTSKNVSVAYNGMNIEFNKNPF